MSKKTKKISELRDTDEVALFIDSKKSIVDNDSVEVKPATVVIMTWFAAKSVLDTGRLDRRKAQLAGWVEISEDKKTRTVHLLNDDTEDAIYADADKSGNSDLDTKVVEMASKLLAQMLADGKTTLDSREAELERREKALQDQSKEAEKVLTQAGVKEGTAKGKKEAAKKEETPPTPAGTQDKTDSSKPVAPSKNGMVE